MKFVITAGICLLISTMSCTKKRESIVVSTGDITESVYASGKVKAVDQYNVYATVTGILQNVMMKEGNLVVRGQPLFALDNVTSELNAENARIALELSVENSRKGSDRLQEIELAVNMAYEKLMLDSSLYVRQKKLWSQNIGTRLEYEQRKYAYENSLTSYQSAKSRLSQLNIQLQNELKRAGLNYDINKKLYSDYLIKSAIDGKIYDVLKEPGELVTPQTPLAIIGNADSFLLELEVDETEILKLKIGQKVLITMDSYKGKLLEAEIDKVYPIMNERTRTFRVEAHFTVPPEKLYPNLTVEANILIQSRKSIITIPNNYIIDGKFVLVEHDQKREIKTGLRNYSVTEVTEGLKPGETIFKP